MTLNTERLNICEMQKLRIFRTMSPVTTEAVQRKVLVTWINNLFSKRMGRVGLPIVTLATGGDRRRLCLHEGVIRCMR